MKYIPKKKECSIIYNKKLKNIWGDKMKSHLYKLFITSLICTLFLSFMGTVSYARTKTIRVGYFEFDNYYEIDNVGDLSGYGYEYLQELLEYTDWEYEYVFASWEECLKMAETGEIDILGFAVKTEYRQSVYEYSDLPIGYTHAKLLVPIDSDYAYDDFEHYNGMRVGMIKGNAKNASFQTFKQKNSFVTTDITFDSDVEMYEALESKEIDAVLISNIYDGDNLKVVSTFDTTPYYYVTKKGNTELLAEINEAMYKLTNDNPQINEQLYQKYYETSGVNSIALTREELEYIKSLDSVTVALAPTRSVLSNYNDNKFGGITYSLMELISEKSGIEFEYIELQPAERAIDCINNSDAQIVAPIMRSAVTEISKEITLISTELPSNLVFVGRMGESLDTKEKFHIVLPKSFINAELPLYAMYPKGYVTYLDSNFECFEAVASGKADVTIENIYVAYNNLRSPRMDGLEILNSYTLNETFSLALSKEDDSLLGSVLSKVIDTISNEEYNEIIQTNTVSEGYKMTLADYIYKFESTFVLAAVLFVLMIAFIIYRQIHFMTVQEANHKLIDALEEKDRNASEVARLEAQRIADMRYQEELQKMLETDTLTGIYNKQGFYNKAREILSHNPDKQYLIVQWDLNRFKIFNDILGIKAGDKLLKDLAVLLESLSGEHELCARLQADHFVELYDVNKFNIVRIMNRMEQWFDVYPIDFELTFCVGVYIIDDPSVDIGIMCDRALLALYKTKNLFGSNYAFYDDELRDRLVAEQEIVSDMATALEEGQFEVYFQPQYSYITNELVGAEALVRWNHPEKGMISPGLFIPIFERNGFVMLLDQYIWEKVCQYLQKWQQDEEYPPISISVNISRHDIYNCDLVGVLSGLIEKYNLPPECLKLEITESAYVENPEQLIGIVDMLQQYGFTLEMDDFGSGYSSLNTLKDVPVDVLKLDMRFLNSSNAARGGNILSSVMRMAKWLDLVVIAEGVETKENADFLSSIGCNYMQGYYFARPMKATDFEKLLKESITNDMKRKPTMHNIVPLEEVWQPDSQLSMLFNTFVGGAALIEYSKDSVEIIRYNEKFLKTMHVNTMNYEQYRRNMLDRMSEEDKQKFVALLTKTVETKEESQGDIYLNPDKFKNIPGMWVRGTATFLADNGESQLFYLMVEDVSELYELRKAQ